MQQRSRVREREPIPDRTDGAGWYANRRHESALRERSLNGKIVIGGEDRPWEICPTGRIYRYMNAGIEDTALGNWWVFASDITVHTGSHRHQGGLVIYVVEGRGYSMVEGVKKPWKEGDLLLLPITPGGVEHQHFNTDPNKHAKWLAFMYIPYYDAVGGAAKMSQDSPQWLAAGKPSIVKTAQDGKDGPEFLIK